MVPITTPNPVRTADDTLGKGWLVEVSWDTLPTWTSPKHRISYFWVPGWRLRCNYRSHQLIVNVDGLRALLNKWKDPNRWVYMPSIEYWPSTTVSTLIKVTCWKIKTEYIDLKDLKGASNETNFDT